jgi:hypothetical protein
VLRPEQIESEWPDLIHKLPAEAMTKHTYMTFGDLEGKLDLLRVECTRCPRKGRYSVVKLIAKYGRRANMMKWKEALNGDCPRREPPTHCRLSDDRRAWE